jgi:hypothetical protein
VLIRSCPAGGLLACVGPLTATAWDVAQRYEQASEGLLRRDRDLTRRTAAVPRTGPARWPTDLGQDLYVIADLRAWLDGLRDDIGRIGGVPEPAEGLRSRVTQSADGP